MALNGPLAVLLAICGPLVGAAPADASFGVASVSVEARTAAGTPSARASSHPAEFSFSLDLNQAPSTEPGDSLRSVRVDLPAGFVGNPLAVPRCPRAEFEGTVPRCSGDSQIGAVEVQLPGVGATVNSLYNLVPPPGFAASFGFSSLEFTGFEQASLRTGRDYGLLETVAPVSNGSLESISETIWGVPADPVHNEDRVCYQSDGTKVEGCASSVQPAPFLTLPATCDAPVEIRVVAESARGVVATKTAALSDSSGNASLLRGCDEVPFKPQMAIGFTSAAADSPTGVSIQLHLPQPSGASTLAESPLRDATLLMPPGLAINPSAVAGLDACAAAQIGLESPPGRAPGEFTAEPARCPDAARVGSVELDTPLVDHRLTGAVYLAEPDRNPFASLVAVYLTVDDEESGVVLKFPAALEADPATGRLTLRLQDAPQFPIEDLRISLPSGPKAILRTPLSCGDAPIQGRFAPWSAPQKAVELAGQLRIVAPAPGLASCPADESGAPAAASFSAGTLVPAAGRSSPFLLKVSRADGTRGLAGIEATLPPGLTAKLAGVTTCTDTEIATASCPAASRVGSADIAAGAGNLPLHLAGSVFLAGPYKGAPFSLEALTPALAGPFDLGTVGVRIALYVDRRSTQIQAVSDPLPTILRGIPLDIRSVAVDLDRPGFALNPTSCEPASVTAAVTSMPGRIAPLGERFQIGECASLGFRPKVSARVFGSTHRGAHPKLRTVLTARAGDANIRGASVTLPATELLDNRHIRAVCPGARFDARSCPAASVVGEAKVWTPLLGRPLEGPIYLRSSNGRLPDLAASLGGQVHLDLSAHVDSTHGRLRIALPSLPDASLSRVVLTMAGGKRGLLVNTGGLCARRHRAGVSFAGQNGKRHQISPILRTDCGKSR